MNATGRQILSRAKETASLPISHSLARLEHLGGTAGEFAKLEARAADLYQLLYPEPLSCGTDYTNGIIMI